MPRDDRTRMTPAAELQRRFADGDDLVEAEPPGEDAERAGLDDEGRPRRPGLTRGLVVLDAPPARPS